MVPSPQLIEYVKVSVLNAGSVKFPVTSNEAPEATTLSLIASTTAQSDRDYA